MNIVIASSDLYSKPGIVTIKSLLVNNQDAEIIHIYYICNELSDASKDQLRRLVKEYHRELTFLNMPKELNAISGLMRTNAIAYTYCYFQDLLPSSVEKVLLIEPDTFVNGSLRQLYDTDIRNCYLAACDDLQSKYCKEKIGLRPASPYFNCGVMLINLKKFREDGISKKITEIIAEGRHKFLYEVQDEMNYCLEGHVRILPPKYNATTAFFLFSYKDMITYRWPSTVCSEKEFEEAREHPVILHFTKNQIIQARPWIQDCTHPYRNEYKKLMADTSIADMELWDSGRKPLNKLVYFVYSKVSPTLIAAGLGVVHAYLYPKFLYKHILR